VTKMGCTVTFADTGTHVISSQYGNPFPAYLYWRAPETASGSTSSSGTASKCHPLGADMALPAHTTPNFDPDKYRESRLCVRNESTTNGISNTTHNSSTTDDSFSTTEQPTITDTAVDISTVTTTAAATAAAGTNLTQSEIEEAIRTLQQELTVSYRNTSSFKRTKTSAADTRASSAAIGASGLFFVISVFGFLSLSDVMSVMQYQLPQKKPQEEAC
ncbi:hypothetical protein ElyMa_005053700, partial [Elysia marginata]